MAQVKKQSKKSEIEGEFLDLLIDKLRKNNLILSFEAFESLRRIEDGCKGN